MGIKVRLSHMCFCVGAFFSAHVTPTGVKEHFKEIFQSQCEVQNHTSVMTVQTSAQLLALSHQPGFGSDEVWCESCQSNLAFLVSDEPLGVNSASYLILQESNTSFWPSCEPGLK